MAASSATRSVSPLTLALVTFAPVLFGCQPPWASGFLLAAVIILAAGTMLFRTARGEPILVWSSGVSWSAGALLAWLLATVLHDVSGGAAQSRAPELSTAKFTFALAFFASAWLGASTGGTRENIARILQALTLLGLVLAAFASAEWLGWDVKKSVGWTLSTNRPSGLYTNANRFAVLMTLCWFSGMALLFDARSRLERGALWRLALPLVSCIAVSICVALTLSRLTIVATALTLLAVSALWFFYDFKSRRRELGEDRAHAETNRMALLLPLVVVLAWISWCFIVATGNLRSRFADLSDLTLDSRYQALQAALPLVKEQPFWGHGLGSFETVFTAVQPVFLTGRWRELHSDWTQLAVEAGIPGLVLSLLLAVVWLTSSWKMAKSKTEAQLDLSRVLPAAGIAVFLLCSIADFPLREPASAILVFYFAGALCAQPAASRTKPGKLTLVAAPVVSLAMLAAAFLSARNGAACAVSPWVGNFYPPATSASQLALWQRAVAIDGGDAELQFRLAASALAASTKDKEALTTARAAIREARRLRPLDHRMPWLESGIAQQSGNLVEARALRERAAELFPNNSVLREQNGRFRLKHFVTSGLPGESERGDQLEKALNDFRTVLRIQPDREIALIDALEWAGCLNTEMAALWPGDEIRLKLRRARFFTEKKQLDHADRQLLMGEPSDAENRAWYYGMRGIVALQRGDAAGAQQNLKLALSAASGAQRTPLEVWIIAQWGELTPEFCESLAGALQSELINYPALSSFLAARLAGAGRWALADALLEKVASHSPELAAQWAELALAMGNAGAASRRAQRAWEQGLSSPRWGDWYTAFQQRIKLRK